MSTEPAELEAPSGLSRAERPGDGQRRVDVSARSPARDQQSHRRSRFPSSTVSREIDRRMPIGREADDERRAAGADERQRDPGDRDQGDDDADVDERLQAQPAGDPGGQQRPERVRGAQRDAHPRVGEELGTGGARRWSRRGSPNSWPTSAKMKSLKAFGTEPPSGSGRGRAQVTRPAPRASNPWTVWNPGALGVGPRIKPGPDSLHLVAAKADAGSPPSARRRPSTARCTRLAPAMKNIVKTGQRDDDRRAEVGLLEHERDHRQGR